MQAALWQSPALGRQHAWAFPSELLADSLSCRWPGGAVWAHRARLHQHRAPAHAVWRRGRYHHGRNQHQPSARASVSRSLVHQLSKQTLQCVAACRQLVQAGCHDGHNELDALTYERACCCRLPAARPLVLQRVQTEAEWEQYCAEHGARVEAAAAELERQGQPREAFKLRLAWSGARPHAHATSCCYCTDACLHDKRIICWSVLISVLCSGMRNACPVMALDPAHPAVWCAAWPDKGSTNFAPWASFDTTSAARLAQMLPEDERQELKVRLSDLSPVAGHHWRLDWACLHAA